MFFMGMEALRTKHVLGAHTMNKVPTLVPR